MSEHSESFDVDNELPMCPCTNAKDIPEVKESKDESETVENGFESFSGESSSDEEQDSLADQGYVPLGQCEAESVNVPSTEIEYLPTTVRSQVNPPDPETVCEIPEPELSNCEGASSSAFSSSKPSMSKDEIDLIKSVMSNIKLPSSSIPEWAKRIPEEKWIAPFVSSLSNQKTDESSKPPEENS